MQFQETLEEAFPFIKQILSDTFHTETHYFNDPDADMNIIDRGMRFLILDKDNLFSPLRQAMQAYQGHHILVVHSTLEFYNVMAFTHTGDEMELITIGPVRDQIMTEAQFHRIIQDHPLAEGHMNSVRQFFFSLPVVDISNLCSTFRHLLTPFDPGFSTVSPEYIDYTGTQYSFVPNTDSLQDFSCDASETYSHYLNAYLDALLEGAAEAASDKLKYFLDYVGYDSTISVSRSRQILVRLNNQCCSRLLTTQIHPNFVLERFLSFEQQIDQESDPSVLSHLPYEITRKYCLLIKNYSMPEYSYLIRNIMNYVTLHISEELTLSGIAEYFHKNPSYISGQFRKETGVNLMEFIQKERMQTALRYFNTTNMSVAEVAGSVGIHDFGYFSRIFKKHIGQTPSQYKKLVKS